MSSYDHEITTHFREGINKYNFYTFFLTTTLPTRIEHTSRVVGHMKKNAVSFKLSSYTLEIIMLNILVEGKIALSNP